MVMIILLFIDYDEPYRIIELLIKSCSNLRKYLRENLFNNNYFEDETIKDMKSYENSKQFDDDIDPYDNAAFNNLSRIFLKTEQNKCKNEFSESYIRTKKLKGKLSLSTIQWLLNNNKIESKDISALSLLMNMNWAEPLQSYKKMANLSNRFRAMTLIST